MHFASHAQSTVFIGTEIIDTFLNILSSRGAPVSVLQLRSVHVPSTFCSVLPLIMGLVVVESRNFDGRVRSSIMARYVGWGRQISERKKTSRNL